MAGYRPPYTRAEEQTIIQYILEEQAHYRLRGDAFWKELADAGIVSRTWQSLKQHFRKHMIFNVDARLYNITDEERYAIRKAYADSASARIVVVQSSDDSTDSDLGGDAVPSGRTSKPSTSASQAPRSQPLQKQKKKEEVDFFTMKFSDDE